MTVTSPTESAFPLGSDKYIYDWLDEYSAQVLEKVGTRWPSLNAHPQRLVLGKTNPEDIDYAELSRYLFGSWRKGRKQVFRFEMGFADVLRSSLNRECLNAGRLLALKQAVYIQPPVCIMETHTIMGEPYPSLLLIQGAAVKVMPVPEENALMVLLSIQAVLNGNLRSLEAHLHFGNLDAPLFGQLDDSATWEQHVTEDFLLYAAYLASKEADIEEGGHDQESGVQFYEVGRTAENLIQVERYHQVTQILASMAGQPPQAIPALTQQLSRTLQAPALFKWHADENSYQLRPTATEGEGVPLFTVRDDFTVTSSNANAKA